MYYLFTGSSAYRCNNNSLWPLLGAEPVITPSRGWSNHRLNRGVLILLVKEKGESDVLITLLQFKSRVIGRNCYKFVNMHKFVMAFCIKTDNCFVLKC